MDLFDKNRSLLVLATFVLEPDANDTGAETSHLHQLVLHKSVGTRVGRVAGPQRVQLLLVQDRPDPRRPLVPAGPASGLPSPAAAPGSVRRSRASAGSGLGRRSTSGLLGGRRRCRRCLVRGQSRGQDPNTHPTTSSSSSSPCSAAAAAVGAAEFAGL